MAIWSLEARKRPRLWLPAWLPRSEKGLHPLWTSLKSGIADPSLVSVWYKGQSAGERMQGRGGVCKEFKLNLQLMRSSVVSEDPAVLSGAYVQLRRSSI